MQDTLYGDVGLALIYSFCSLSLSLSLSLTRTHTLSYTRTHTRAHTRTGKFQKTATEPTVKQLATGLGEVMGITLSKDGNTAYVSTKKQMDVKTYMGLSPLYFAFYDEHCVHFLFMRQFQLSS